MRMVLDERGLEHRGVRKKPSLPSPLTQAIFAVLFKQSVPVKALGRLAAMDQLSDGNRGVATLEVGFSRRQLRFFSVNERPQPRSASPKVLPRLLPQQLLATAPNRKRVPEQGK